MSPRSSPGAPPSGSASLPASPAGFLRSHSLLCPPPLVLVDVPNGPRMPPGGLRGSGFQPKEELDRMAEETRPVDPSILETPSPTEAEARDTSADEDVHADPDAPAIERFRRFGISLDLDVVGALVEGPNGRRLTW